MIPEVGVNQCILKTQQLYETSCAELCSQAPVHKEIVVAGGFRDEVEIKSSTGTTDLGPLEFTHDEAGTRLALHAVHSQCHTVVVSSRDTDVLLLQVSRFQSIKCQQLWMKYVNNC